MFKQVVNNVNDTILLLNHVVILLMHHLGWYGSVNVGDRGLVYTWMRNEFLTLRNHFQHVNRPANLANVNFQNYVDVIDFLTESMSQLPQYGGAGPGGQGNAKVNLNIAIANTKRRVFELQGVIHFATNLQQVDHTQYQNWANIFNALP